MNKILAFILFINVLSCEDSTDKKKKIFYIVKHPTGYRQDTIKDSPQLPPPPPRTFYSNFNFILFVDTTIYFHDKYINTTCWTNVDFDKPPKLFLDPENLKEIKIDTLSSFLYRVHNKIKNKNKLFFCSISSPTDTIRNEAFVIISNFLNANNVRSYNIRNWTEEEKFVSISKKTNTKYYPNSINWKIGFAGE